MNLVCHLVRVWCTPLKSILYTDKFVVPRHDIAMGDNIGTGTFGVVYKANWAGKVVAVKVVAIPDDSIKEATLREVCIHR